MHTFQHVCDADTVHSSHLSVISYYLINCLRSLLKLLELKLFVFCTYIYDQVFHSASEETRFVHSNAPFLVYEAGSSN